MKKYFNVVQLLIILLFTINIVNAQNYSDSLDIELSNIFSKSQLPGFGVSIVNNDRILYQKGFGFANKEKQIPYTVNTIQPIASVSKTLIAVSIMKAIEDGYFTLETDINDLLPFRVENPNYPNDTIKIKHLVTHTSGIIDSPSDYFKAFYFPEKPILQENSYTSDELKHFKKISKNKKVTLGDFLKKYLKSDGEFYSKKHFSKNKTGEKYQYSNVGANLTAYIIEIATGLSYADYTKKYIIAPLNMKNTDWGINKADSNSKAVLYSEKSAPLPVYMSSLYPSGFLSTTINDLSKFLIEVIKGYNGQGKLISHQSYQIMLDSHFVLKPKHVGNLQSVGVFWERKTNGSIGHPGGNLGISTFMYYYPESKTGLMFFTNTNIELNQDLVKQFISIWRVLEKHQIIATK